MRSLCAGWYAAVGIVVSACAPGATARLRTLTPAPGTIVTADSVIEVTVEYHLRKPDPRQWFLLLLFDARQGGTRTVADSSRDPQVALRDSAGVITLRQPLRPAWQDRALRRPFRVWVFLNRTFDGTHSTPIRTFGPFAFRMPSKE